LVWLWMSLGPLFIARSMKASQAIRNFWPLDGFG
jgi:hypothetical protein